MKRQVMMLAVAWLVAVHVAPAPRGLHAAEEDPNDALMEMITELVNDADRDMRALGLQQVREEVPGQAATKKFTELLPTLAPDAQAGLLEALGDRGDAVALPAVLQSLASDQPVVRAAALRALGAVGGKDEVSVLADKAATGSDQEKAAARQSLARLRGENINEAIESLATDGSVDVRVTLLGVLASRDAKQSLPTVLAGAEATEAAVRLAALQALRYLADGENVADVVELLKKASDDTQRRTAELALLTICSRARQACVEPIVAGMDGADVASRAVLLNALSRASGARALAAVGASLKDDDETVRDEAVRMLSRWPDTQALPYLRELAESDNLRHQVLAIRGLVRLAGPQEDKPADLSLLADVMRLAQRPEEKRLVLGTLGSLASPESLVQVTAALDDTEVADEASLAAVLIAENMPNGDPADVKRALEKVVKVAGSDSIRQRAQKILATL